MLDSRPKPFTPGTLGCSSRRAKWPFLSPPSSGRKVLSQLTMTLVGICFGLLFAEACVRFYDPHARDHVLPPAAGN
jgi:hypothetical protein